MRQRVHAKYGGRCAYCGAEITVKQMQVDHVIPKRRYSEKHGCLIVDCRKFEEYGVDDFRNLNPACRTCNNWKGVYMLEEFRAEIAVQVERLRLRSANFRMAERYGMVAATEKPITFYFETLATTEE